MTNDLKKICYLTEDFATESHVLESINDGFFALDKDWNFIYVNHVFETILGINREDIIGENYRIRFPESTYYEFHDHYLKAMLQNESIHFEALCPPNNIWIAVNAYPTENGLAVYFQDVTDKKNAQKALFAESQNLKAIINNTEDLIWSVDIHFHILCANNAFLKRTAEIDYAVKEHKRQADHSLFMDRSWLCLYKKALHGQAFKKIRKCHFKHEDRYEEISLNPIYGKSNEITGISCISRDITEQQKRQYEIEERNQRLKEIAWIQSHQLRNHVANLLGLTEVLTTEICDVNMIHMIKSSVEKIDIVLRQVCVQAER